MLPQSDSTFDVGASNRRWKNAYLSGDLTLGDVDASNSKELVFGSQNAVIRSYMNALFIQNKQHNAFVGFTAGASNYYGTVRIKDMGGVDKFIFDYYYGRMTAKDRVRFNPASALSSPQEGDVYYDSTAKKLRVYNGTAWETISST